MNNKLLFLLLTAFLLLGFIIGCQWREMRSEGFKTSDTITVVEFDTVTITKDTTITKFIPKIIEKLRVDTIKKDTVLITERKTYNDTICQNQDSILLKTTISGINARIDSLQVSLKKQETIITNTIEITKYVEQKKRFHIGPSFTAGYDPINGNFGMMIGVAALFDLY